MRTLDSRGDWVALIEAIHTPAADDAEWADRITDAARPLFPSASALMVYALSYDTERKLTGVPLLPPQGQSMFDSFVAMTRAAAEIWIPFHFDAPVRTAREVMRSLEQDMAHGVYDAHRRQGYGDSIGVVSHPRPGLVTTFAALFDDEVKLAASERELLARIPPHLEAGYRLRDRSATVLAEIGPSGIVHGEPGTRRLEAHIAGVREARKRRSSDSTELWRALVEGRVSVIPRGRGYLVVDNPAPSFQLRALTQREVAVLSLAARGSSSKHICYALGLSPSAVSSNLRSAAAKLGVLSRTELIRVAALLARDPKGLLHDDALTEAEAEVLELLERGLRNEQIAALRGRSVRTIANQVASLLRKTGSSSRRQLVARAAARQA